MQNCVFVCLCVCECVCVTCQKNKKEKTGRRGRERERDGFQNKITHTFCSIHTRIYTECPKDKTHTHTHARTRARTNKHSKWGGNCILLFSSYPATARKSQVIDLGEAKNKENITKGNKMCHTCSKVFCSCSQRGQRNYRFLCIKNWERRRNQFFKKTKRKRRKEGRNKN